MLDSKAQHSRNGKCRLQFDVHAVLAGGRGRYTSGKCVPLYEAMAARVAVASPLRPEMSCHRGDSGRLGRTCGARVGVHKVTRLNAATEARLNKAQEHSEHRMQVQSTDSDEQATNAEEACLGWLTHRTCRLTRRGRGKEDMGGQRKTPHQSVEERRTAGQEA